MRQRALLAIPALALALVMAFVAPVQAGAMGSDAADYVARINALRASVGVGPLQVDDQLTAAAQVWSDHMAATQTLAHAPNIAAGVTEPWTKLGENVGVGPSNSVIWPAFVASAHHYANIVDPAFTRVGVGVSYGGGRQWTCHRFMALGGGSPAPAPPPAPSPKPQPKPKPAAQPAPTTTTTAPPAVTPAPSAPVVPPPSPSGPPPPADSARVATVLSALRQLSS